MWSEKSDKHVILIKVEKKSEELYCFLEKFFYSDVRNIAIDLWVILWGKGQ